MASVIGQALTYVAACGAGWACAWAANSVMNNADAPRRTAAKLPFARAGNPPPTPPSTLRVQGGGQDPGSASTLCAGAGGQDAGRAGLMGGRAAVMFR